MTTDSLCRLERIAATFTSTRFKEGVEALRRVASRLNRDFTPVPLEVVCRKCHWPCSQPSRRTNALDRVLALFLLRPFRCRSCQRRYYRLAL